MISKRCKTKREYTLSRLLERHLENIVKPRKKRAIKKETIVGSWLLELPMDIICNTLSRLPTQTIFSCRCVCKPFVKILTDPYFAQLHLTKAPDIDQSVIIQDEMLPSNLFLANMLDLETWKNNPRNCDSLPPKTLNIIPTILSKPKHVIRAMLVSSCNGLLCVKYLVHNMYLLYVCNPILGEFMRLPCTRIGSFRIAFGFCPNAKKYKVIRFLDDICEIHTLGTKKWGKIYGVPCPKNLLSFTTLLNGNLYWITKSSTTSKLICSFNLETEKVLYISPPTHFDQDTLKRMNWICVGTLDGLFCVWYILNTAIFEVWVLKGYGAQESWSRVFSVDIGWFYRDVARLQFRPLEFSNGNLFFFYGTGPLFYFDCRTRTVEKILSSPAWRTVVIYTPSFVSVKDIAMKGIRVDVVPLSEKGIPAENSEKVTVP